MQGIGRWFFTAGAVLALIGMGWGIQMAISQDHMLAPAHAHLNLVGWVTLSLFGVYYALTPRAADGWLPRVHLVLAVAGVVLMVPGIAIAVSGGSEALAATGSILTIASMLIFVVTILRHGFGPLAR